MSSNPSKKQKLKYQYVDIEAEDSEWSSEYSEDVDGISESAYKIDYKKSEWAQFDEIDEYEDGGEMKIKNVDVDESDEGIISGGRYHRLDVDRFNKLDEEEGELDNYVAQSNLLPTPLSPKLWLLRVKVGKEKQIVLKIQAKNSSSKSIVSYGGDSMKKSSSNIYSVLCKDSLPGYVYVEACSKQHVIESISGIGNIKPNRIDVIPLDEMVEVLSNGNERSLEDIQINSFGRIKKGKYKDDICEIIGFVSYNVAKIKIVPRIHGIKKLMHFHINDTENIHEREIIRKKDIIVYKKDVYRNGFLEKDIPLTNILFDDVQPTVKELELFRNKKIYVGEKIRVIKGEYINLEGSIVGVNGDKVKIKTNGDNNYLDVELNGIEKNYAEGDEISFNLNNKQLLGVIVKKINNEVIISYNDFTEEIKLDINEIFNKNVGNIDVTKSLHTASGLEPQRKNIRRNIRNPLFNRKVEIKVGEYKGLVGTIKDVAQYQCKVQLDSNLESVYIDTKHLDIKENTYKPIYKRDKGAQTPGYKTPGYRTPGYATPGYRTPGYATPGYRTPGYTTPGYTTIEDNDRIPEEEIEPITPNTIDGIFNNVLIFHNNQEYTIKDITDTVAILKDGTRIKREDLTYVYPNRYDRVCIMEGERKGFTGLLVKIIEDKGDVRSSEEMVKDVPLKDISKMA
ncbi:Transcription factor SPT5 [Spraguea lophii 42_110]|uniref:Chromatin elongation factor SPT5 n=1 Tax=Spraguea lophii (strain 42_110) TaxID=1358809 RepID=S7W938_SPRLO|nr:Transcription factor SPT5 [Spraguea lophii 42_110]